MLYIRILEQNEILRLRHVLVLVSLPDKVLMFVELLTGNGTYTANILSTPCPRVSVIKRLSLYEFASKGRDFVSIVHIREGLYYRGIF